MRDYGKVKLRRSLLVRTDIWSDRRFATLSTGAGLALFKLASASTYANECAATPAELAETFGDTPLEWLAWINEMRAAGVVDCSDDFYRISLAHFRSIPRYLIGKWQQLRRAVFKRDDHTCQYCGKKNAVLHVDHVIPKSRGGTNDQSNLVTACASCNLRKGAMTPDEWKEKMGVA